MSSIKWFFGQILKAIFLVSSWLVAHSPRRLQMFYGFLLGTLWFDILRIRRAVAIGNVKKAFPDISDAEATRIARRSLWHMGLTIVELCIFPHFKRSWMPRFINFDGMENLENAKAKGKGVCLLTLHLSNPDFGALGLSHCDLPVHVISKLFKTKWLNDYWFGVRGQHGTHFIPPEKSSFQILKALKKNEIVAFVLDQFMGPPVGVRTTFFGHTTGTAAGLATMVERSRSPVIPAFVKRDKNGLSTVVIEPEIPFEEKDSRQSSIEHMTQVYTYKIEEIVKKYPEQWMWIHKRWKPFRD